MTDDGPIRCDDCAILLDVVDVQDCAPCWATLCVLCQPTHVCDPDTVRSLDLLKAGHVGHTLDRIEGETEWAEIQAKPIEQVNAELREMGIDPQAIVDRTRDLIARLQKIAGED